MSLNCPHAWEEYKKLDTAYNDLRREYLALRAEQANFTNVSKDWLLKMREFRLICKAVGKNWQNNLENNFRDVFFAKNIVQFKEQYHTQYETLKKLKLLRLLPESKKMGIIGIDDKEYPIPTWQHIQAMIADNREKYETKMRQGFTKLQLTPFALSLREMILALEESLVKHCKKLKLPVEKKMFLLDDWWDRIDRPNFSADKLGGIKYYPKKYKRGQHEGWTKQEILDQQVKGSNYQLAGWQIILVQDDLIFSSRENNETIGERKPFEAFGETPISCLKKLQNDPQYSGEQGFTNEDWLLLFMNNLLENNRIIDNIDESLDLFVKSYLLASWKPMSKTIGVGYSDRHPNFVACLETADIDEEINMGMCRTAVGISED